MFNGDALASEFTLLNLLSRVHTRKDAFILGNLSINLTDANFFTGRYLSQLIQAITPFSVHLPINIDSLENKRFSPRKDYDTNLLESGLLQLIDGTFILADETSMKEGQLTNKGIASIKSLATLIEQQVVEYDFQYYQ
jgi:hypothetical protein